MKTEMQVCFLDGLYQQNEKSFFSNTATSLQQEILTWHD